MRDHALRLGSLVALVALWGLGALAYGDPAFVPYPHTVFREIWTLIVTGEFAVHMRATIVRVVIGFLIALVLSFGVGTLMGLRDAVEKSLELFVLVGLTIPGLVWAMIGILLFGINELAPVFAIVVIVVPVITLNFWQGTKAIDYDLLEMARIFEAGRPAILRHIVLPQLVPYMLASVRFGFALAWKVVVLSELFGLSNGVGYMINHHFQQLSMVGVLAWAIVFTLVMIAFEYLVVGVLERRLTAWRPRVAF